MKSTTTVSAAMLAIVSVNARQLPASFTMPLQQFKGDGTRTISGWQLEGDTKLRMAGARLTTDMPNIHGEMWTTTDQSLHMGSELGMTTTFRVSGRGGLDEIGGSLTWYLVHGDKELPSTTAAGVPTRFHGIAVMLDRPTEEAKSLRGHADRITVWANDGTEESRQLGSCGVNVQYDENRHDFDPALISSLRLLYGGGRIKLEVDARGTGEFRPCMDVRNDGVPINTLSGGRVGIVGLTGSEKRNNFEVMKVALFDSMAEAESDVYQGTRGEKRSVQILHYLEHELFEVNQKLTKSLQLLEQRMHMEWEHIDRIDEKLSNAFLGAAEGRVSGIEAEYIQRVVPWLDNISSRIEGAGSNLIETHASTMGAFAWLRPAIVFLALLGLLYHYQRKQFMQTKKLNSSYM